MSTSWNWRELRGRGYRVRGVRHNLRGRIFRVRGGYRLLQAWPAVDELLDLLASRQPRWAHTLLVWKDTGLARARACGIESASR